MDGRLQPGDRLLEACTRLTSNRDRLGSELSDSEFCEFVLICIDELHLYHHSPFNWPFTMTGKIFSSEYYAMR